MMWRNVNVSVLNRNLIQPHFTKLSVRFSNNNSDDNSKKKSLEDLENIVKLSLKSYVSPRPNVIRQKKIKKTVFDYNYDETKEEKSNMFLFSSLDNVNKTVKANNEKETIQEANISGSEKRNSIDVLKLVMENGESVNNAPKSIKNKNRNLRDEKAESMNRDNNNYLRISQDTPPTDNIKLLMKDNADLGEESVNNVPKSIKNKNRNLRDEKAESMNRDNNNYLRISQDTPPTDHINSTVENNADLGDYNVNESTKANNEKKNIQDANTSGSENSFSFANLKFIFENNSMSKEISPRKEKSKQNQKPNILEQCDGKAYTTDEKTEALNTKNNEEEKARNMSNFGQDVLDLIGNLKYHQVYKKFQDDYEISAKESFLEKKDPSKRLNIFQIDKIKEAQTKGQPESCLKIMDMVDSCEFRCLNMSYPDSQFHEWIQLTKDKKMWKFPIDNEQDSEELKVGFHEHVFPQQYLSGKLPKTGLVDKFMNYVCLGLSQSPHLTVKDKKAHVKWFEEYLLNKLDEINMVEEKRIHDKQYEDEIKNK